MLRLWRGFEPNCTRAMVVTASQFVTYDYAKQALLARFSALSKDSLVCVFVISRANASHTSGVLTHSPLPPFACGELRMQANTHTC